MRPGWQQPIGEWAEPQKVVGIIVSMKFPDEELLKSKLREGLDKLGNSVVWVVRGGPIKSNDATRWAMEVFAEYEIEPVLASSNTPYWGPLASGYRDAELTSTCERLVVFHDISSGITSYFVDATPTVAKVNVVRAGVKKTAKRKKREPVGV